VKTLKKIVTTTFLICMVALLSTLSLPLVHATKPLSVSATFDYTFSITRERWVGDRHYIFEATEWEVWSGDFEGTAVSFFKVMWFNYPSGPLNVWLRSEFEGTVMGNEGTLVIQLVGWRHLPDDWVGQWVIIRGTGELTCLHGQGTWGGPGFGASGPDISVSGQLHLD
jgi:hypothetical protein